MISWEKIVSGISLAVLLGGGFYEFGRLHSRMDQSDKTLEKISQQIEKLSDRLETIHVDQAVLQSRLAGLESRQP